MLRLKIINWLLIYIDARDNYLQLIIRKERIHILNIFPRYSPPSALFKQIYHAFTFYRMLEVIETFIILFLIIITIIIDDLSKILNDNKEILFSKERLIQLLEECLKKGRKRNQSLPLLHLTFCNEPVFVTLFKQG